jgi:hypothetical protein
VVGTEPPVVELMVVELVVELGGVVEVGGV